MIAPSFEFRHPDEPLVRVDRLAPAAPDGREWQVKVLGLARALARQHGSVTPSMLRERAALLGLEAHHSSAWGGVWALLRAERWTRGGELGSKTATRNAARESRWFPPEGDTR